MSVKKDREFILQLLDAAFTKGGNGYSPECLQKLADIYIARRKAQATTNWCDES